MVDLKIYIAMLKLAQDTSVELGLDGLSKTDQLILTTLYDNFSGEEFSITYFECLKLLNNSNLSKTQFYKSMERLIEDNIIEKLGTQRSHTYKFSFK